MSKIDELINQLCPDGAPLYSLNELFTQFSGMGGVKNKWSDSGNCQFIDYMNAYTHISIDVTKLPFATVKKLDQTILKRGDVLFTSASETPDECAISSVIEDEIVDGIFLDDHLFGLRVKDGFKKAISPSYLKYAFRANTFRTQLNKAVRGVTRYYVSKPDFMKLKIFLPPLEVQSEIARILDNFTELTAELTAELVSRKKQYVHYRQQLLTFDDSVKKVKVGEVCDVFTGGEPPRDCIKGNTADAEHPYAVWGNGKDVYGYSGTYRIDKDAVVISSIGANTGSVYFHKAFFTPIIRLKVIVPKDESLDMRFLYHAMSAIKIESKSSSVPNMNASEIKALLFPLPNIEEQRRIARILDKFDVLCEDLSIGIPAEIEACNKQYEFYRDKLLAFDELKAA